MSTDDMSCQRLVELVTEYFEGTLSPTERERFEEHLTTCPPCRIYVEQMRHTVRVLGRLPEESIGSEARDRLLRAFRDWRTG